MSKKDKILYDKNNVTRKRYGTKRLLIEFPNKHWPLSTVNCEASTAEDR